MIAINAVAISERLTPPLQAGVKWEALPSPAPNASRDRKSTRLNSSHLVISYAVFCLKNQIRRREAGRSRRSVRPHGPWARRASAQPLRHPIRRYPLLLRASVLTNLRGDLRPYIRIFR